MRVKIVFQYIFSNYVKHLWQLNILCDTNGSQWHKISIEKRIKKYILNFIQQKYVFMNCISIK